MYKKTKNLLTGLEMNIIMRINDNAFIPFDPANNDYANFKEQILANEAELQDADGNTMSSEAAQTFVRGLP
jgi:hypothetical protein